MVHILITSAGNLLYFLVDFRQLGLLNVIINCAVLQILNHFCDQAPHNDSPDTFLRNGSGYKWTSYFYDLLSSFSLLISVQTKVIYGD